MDSPKLSCADSNEPNPHPKAAATISIRITPNRFMVILPIDMATSLSWDHQAQLDLHQ
jgi:hypothetical protein